MEAAQKTRRVFRRVIWWLATYIASEKNARRRALVCLCLEQALEEIESLTDALPVLPAYVDSFIRSHIPIDDLREFNVDEVNVMTGNKRVRFATAKLHKAILSVTTMPETTAELVMAAQRFNDMIFEYPWTDALSPRRRCRHNPRPVL
jgi:GTP1/Obg family GTP-binding protein